MIQKSNIARRRKAAQAEGGIEYKNKRDELIRVAAVLFKEKGYQATTLNEIAAAAGMDRASIYYYVDNKEEFFREAIKGVLDANTTEAERLMRMRSLNPKEKLEQLVTLLMRSYDENYPYMYLYIQEEMHAVAEQESVWAQEMVRQTQRFEKVVITLFKKGIEDGLFRSDISPGLAANALFGMFNWSHRWYKPGTGKSAEAVAQAFCKIFFDGFEQR
ncbi:MULTISPECIES: TetR/AcrR family transcriptional regulator [Pseudomonas]|uniref:TetR family transcriptional regulator n=1 Tax=Pseudomonas monteilii TaxID=76759 RepID=A0AAE6RDR4_9PSED|nr:MULTISPECIES: TetR/AcrR family transcriptional regulator [Pseudomonas]MDH4549900.1 TetR/AcrR family transcriptional regulator [Pseudomonas sp. BN607]MDH4846098.1 TetR/AcrR family transcriptional regulator [Pseudomonas sp. BN605]MDH4858770.1 TetR/AcrR family transcriptional regulator [Pseudomonas sp. BN505]NWL08049.1 TetR/AcrR family transcriptional regulator [Pseudomonas hunanensis]QHB28812.1 TetR family transcriptional regulator [Pseudomonas monteilii]